MIATGHASMASLSAGDSKFSCDLIVEYPSSLKSKCSESMPTQAPHPIQASSFKIIFFISFTSK